MINTVPAQRKALFETMPEVAAFARPAVRLHPRRAEPTAEHSSAGGPLLLLVSFFGTDAPQPVRFDHKVTPAYSWPADRLAELLA